MTICEQVRSVLTDLGWRFEPDALGFACFYSRDNKWMAEVANGSLGIPCWSLYKFTDSDIDGVAGGRFVTVVGGQEFWEFTAALAEHKLDGIKL
jgi:hypothetical protein